MGGRGKEKREKGERKKEERNNRMGREKDVTSMRDRDEKEKERYVGGRER